MKTKVSVIVAMYNTLSFLEPLFNCFKRQTLKDFEIIIVDDLSTDGSYEYVENFIKENKELNIKLIKGKEKMLPDLARKVAFAHCNGEYVIYVDTDDEFSDNYFEELYELAKENNLDFSVSSCQRINEEGEKTSKVKYLAKKTIPLMTNKQKNILIRGRYGGWNRMARRDYLIEKGYDYLSAELPLFILQFDEKARVGYTRKGCYYYRARGGSISTSKVPQRIANYDLLEPIRWLKTINVSKVNRKALGVYLFRMICPYIYYKKYFVDEYNFKEDIRFVKRECNYSFFAAMKYWWVMDKRDKVMLPAFVFGWHCIVFRFIKKYRT